MSGDASFSTDGSKIIEAVIECNSNSNRDRFSLEEYYDLEYCVDWLKSHDNITKVGCNC